MNTMLWKLAFPLVLIAGLLVGGCQDMGMKPMMQKSLYDRLGGKDALTAVVDDFVGNVAADKRINGFFAKAGIPRLKRNLVDQICQGTGGPCVYTGKDMKTAHKGMGIADADFNALVEDLVKTLNKFNVPEADQASLLGILGFPSYTIAERAAHRGQPLGQVAGQLDVRHLVDALATVRAPSGTKTIRGKRTKLAARTIPEKARLRE